MTARRMRLISIDPALVDFSPASGRNAEQVRAAGDDAQERLTSLGLILQRGVEGS
jgi:hypothetical protein